jgi:hypothetical protein
MTSFLEYVGNSTRSTLSGWFAVIPPVIAAIAPHRSRHPATAGNARLSRRSHIPFRRFTFGPKCSFFRTSLLFLSQANRAFDSDILELYRIWSRNPLLLVLGICSRNMLTRM